MSEWLTIIGLACRLALLIFEKNKNAEAEERRKALAELDDALENKDMTKLSEWMGKRL